MKPSNPHLPGQIADVDLRLLRVFKSVVECGGMAAAELELNVGMPTISRQIRIWRSASDWCCAAGDAPASR